MVILIDKSSLFNESFNRHLVLQGVIKNYRAAVMLYELSNSEIVRRPERAARLD